MLDYHALFCSRKQEVYYCVENDNEMFLGINVPYPRFLELLQRLSGLKTSNGEY